MTQTRSGTGTRDRSLDFMRPCLHGFRSLGQRLPALVVCVLFLAIAWFGLGSDLNVPALLWYREGKVWPILSGFSVTLLFGYVWLITYLVDAREGEPFLFRTAKAQTTELRRWNCRLICLVVPVSSYVAPNEVWQGLRWYFTVTWLPLLGLLAVAACLDPAQRWPFLTGMLLAVLSVRLTVIAVNRASHRLERRPNAAQALNRLKRTEQAWLVAVARVTFTCLVLLYAMLYVVCAFLPAVLPPVVSVCVLCGVLVGVSGAIWFHFPRLALPAFGMVIFVAIACNSYPYKLRFPGMGPEYQSILSLSEDEEPKPPDQVDETIPEGREEKERVERLCRRLYRQLHPDAPPGSLVDRGRNSYRKLYNDYIALQEEVKPQGEATLNQWRTYLKQREAKSAAGDKPKLVVVAVSGGANRSALWTGLVLQKLEENLRVTAGASVVEFPRHARVIAGASGGMIGAAQYVATLAEDGHPTGFDTGRRTTDSLSPILNRLVFREVPCLFLPLPYYSGDRGQALEEALTDATPELNNSFADLIAGEKAGWRPSLIFSPMLLEDGRRLLIGNPPLPFVSMNQGSFLVPATGVFPTESSPVSDRPLPWAGKQSLDGLRPGQSRKQLADSASDMYSRSAVEFFRLFPDVRARFTVGTAARMNASFPYVSPAVDLPTEPPRRVVDAGYYDNYGVDVAALWIYHYRDWIVAYTSGVVLIQVRDSVGQNRRRFLTDPDDDGPGPLAKRWSYATGFLTGPPQGAGAARQSIMSFRNDELVRILSDFFHPSREDFFTTVVFELPGEIAMNWYLTESDKQAIRQGFRTRPEQPDTPNDRSLRRLQRWWNDGW